MAIDLEAARAMLENRPKSSSGGDGDLRWVSFPKEGEMKIRFLPPAKESSLPGRIINTHWNLLDDDRSYKKCLCFKTFKEECPICNMLELYNDRINTDDWQASARSYINVLVLENSEYDSTLPYILGSSDYNLYWLLENIIDPDIGDITDPINGHNVTFTRKTPNGAFDRKISLKTTPIADSEERISNILNNIFDLSKIWKAPDDEYLIYAKKLAKNTEKVIKERLLKLTQENQESDIDEQENKKEDDKKESNNNSTINSKAPKGAPDCFGIDWKEDLKKCQVCPHEFLCQNVKEEEK